MIKDGSSIKDKVWNSWKLKLDEFKLEIAWFKKNKIRVIKHWNNLPRIAVGSLSLDVLKSKLDFF